MPTLKSLGKKLINRAEVFSDRGRNLAISTANVILKELTSGTPVDTSQALSNWQVGVGFPRAPRIMAHVPGKQGSTQEQSANVSNALGLAQMQRSKLGQSIYISNSLDYIKSLDDGENKRDRRPGFVGKSVDAGLRHLRSKTT